MTDKIKKLKAGDIVIWDESISIEDKPELTEAIVIAIKGNMFRGRRATGGLTFETGIDRIVEIKDGQK